MTEKTRGILCLTFGINFVSQILYFFPENPYNPIGGNRTRARSLLENFRREGHHVTFVSDDRGGFAEGDLEAMRQQGLILKYYLLRENSFLHFLRESLPKFFGLPTFELDRARFGQSRKFKEILKNENYDTVIISYVLWANLLGRKKPRKMRHEKYILDTHDFITAQFQLRRWFDLGKYFATEISTMRRFDYVLTLSEEERYLFAQFVGADKVLHVAHGRSGGIRNAESDYDIIYVASANEHNVSAARWFFNEVYPLLPATARILVVGQVALHINTYANVTLVQQTERLNEYYAASRMAICPMFSGTGLKIKIVEAMAYGLPVVTSRWGTNGLPNKTRNGCVVATTAKDFADSIERLLIDKAHYDQVSAASKLFFDDHFDETIVYNTLNKIL